MLTKRSRKQNSSSKKRKGPEAAARKAARQPFEEWLALQKRNTTAEYSAWKSLIGNVESSEGTLFTQSPDAIIQTHGPHPNQDDYRLITPVKLARITGLKLEVMPHDSHTNKAFTRGKSGEFILTDVKLQVRKMGSSQLRDIAISKVVADFVPAGKGGYGDVKGLLDDDPRNGWTTQGANRDHNSLRHLRSS
jgi:hypothetical protein